MGGDKTCAFKGCSRDVKAKGLCNGHYQQARSGKELRALQPGSRTKNLGKKCAFLGCTRDAICKGLCDGHYQQKRAGKELAPLQVIRKGQPCSVEGCNRPHEAKGFCHNHYDRWRVYGNPLAKTKADPSAIRECSGHLEVELHGKHSQNGCTKISLEDREFVEGRRFWVSRDGYARCKVDGVSVSLHRLLLGSTVGEDQEVDHINRDRLDNRRENLRVVTKAQQNQNRKVRSDSRTGHRNVHYNSKKDLYRVIVTKDGKRYGHRHKKLEDALAEASALRDQLFTHSTD